MNRIDRRFTELRDAARKALIPYLTAGAPDPEWTAPIMHALAGAGADLIELGMPFSDPMADGPVIQKACERALEHGVGLKGVLAIVEEFRRRDTETPVVLMGYLNPIERFGTDEFLKQAADAGVDGLLLVDLPPEEGEEVSRRLAELDLRLVRLVAPTTPAARMKRICETASGFVYYVSLKGVTGAANLDMDTVTKRLDELRAHTDLPLAVGFGVKDAKGAAAVARVADAVVIGSALVSRLAEADNLDAARDAATIFLKPLRRALDEPATTSSRP